MSDTEDIAAARRALGERLAQLRMAAGLSQPQLARLIGYGRSTIATVETGRRTAARGFWQRCDQVLASGGVLARQYDQLEALRQQHRADLQRAGEAERQARLLAMHRSSVRLADVGADETSSPPQVHTSLMNQTVALDNMKRRTLTKWSVATVAAAGLSVSAGTSVGMADVKRLQRSAARLHSLDQRHGGDMLWRAALAEAHEGVQLLEYGSYTETVGQHLLTATGRLQICAGWLALDAGQHEVARSCLGEALAMSRQANDVQIETRALANLAYQSNMLARPREALRYAMGAEHAATGHGSTSWLMVIPQLRMAIGSSLAGSGRDADRALQVARRELEQDSATPNEEWSAFLSSAEIDGVEATCAIELGRSAHAERLLEQTIASYGQQFARNLAGWRVRLARARLDMGAVDGATEAAHSALDDLTGEVASWRITTELDAVVQRLTEYPNVDGVEGFLARYQDVNQ